MPIALLLLWGFFGVRGYMRAQRFERQYGRELGGCPAFVWAIICFATGLIGIIVEIFVMKSAVKKAQPTTTVWTPAPYGAQQYAAPPQYAGPIHGGPGQVSPPPAAAPPAGQWAPPPPPPGMDVPFQPGPNVGGSDFLPRKN